MPLLLLLILACAADIILHGMSLMALANIWMLCAAIFLEMVRVAPEWPDHD